MNERQRSISRENYSQQLRIVKLLLQSLLAPIKHDWHAYTTGTKEGVPEGSNTVNVERTQSHLASVYFGTFGA